jgi:hypothetical protein
MDDYFDDAQGRPILDNWWALNQRPVLMAFYQNEVQTPGSDAHAAALDVAKMDYVVQQATVVGFNNGIQIPPQTRFSRLETGQYWMLGFLEWYCVAPNLLRGDTINHRGVADDCDAGKLIMARRNYPQIDWSLDYIKRPDCVWNAASVSAADLLRINNFWGRALVQTWQVVHGQFGYIRMPKTVTYAGKSISLGWEVVHDWILPPDANHGVGMLTISHMISEIDKYNKVGSSLQTSIRRRTDGYEFTSGNQTHIIAIGKTTGDVVSCYRV